MDKIRFKDFQEFLAGKCFDLNEYKAGNYDRKIFNFFMRRIKKIEKARINEKKCNCSSLSEDEHLVGCPLYKYE